MLLYDMRFFMVTCTVILILFYTLRTHKYILHPFCSICGPRTTRLKLAIILLRHDDGESSQDQQRGTWGKKIVAGRALKVQGRLNVVFETIKAKHIGTTTEIEIEMYKLITIDS